MDAAILTASEKHPKPAEKVFQYGTAGFRMKVCVLRFLDPRMECYDPEGCILPANVDGVTGSSIFTLC